MPLKFEQHHLRHHPFADRMQGIKQGKPSNVRDITAGLGARVSSVNNLCASKRLQLKENRSDVVWFGNEPQENHIC